MRTNIKKIWFGIALAAGSIALATAARGADDTARFYGTWQTSFPFNGQTVTMVSVHDAGGYKNYVNNVPVGNGSFSAANGKYTAAAPPPNDSGTYHFINDNTIIATNSAGQTVTWTRVKTSASSSPAPAPATAPPPAAAPPAAAPAPAGAMAPDPSLPPETNAAIAAFNQKDFNTAWRDFMAGAQKGDSEAQAGVGAMLFKHLNPPGTGFYAQCEKWLLESANQGNPRGMDFLAQYYYATGVSIAGGINPGVNNSPIPPALQKQAEGRFAMARQWFERAAAKDDLYAMGNLAIMLDTGVGGPRDSDRAAQLRAEVAKGPDANFGHRATADPGNLAMTAAWQAGHYQDALKTAQALAAKGDPAAEAVIGKSYYEGIGVAQSYSAALPWFNKAAAQKNPDALFFLGMMYEYGRGVNQDVPKAQSLFDQAASLGQRNAAMEAAGMRMEGAAAEQAARYAAVCRKAGGYTDGPLCLRGGEAIDPY